MIVFISNLSSFIRIHWMVYIGDHAKCVTFIAMWGRRGWVSSTETFQNYVPITGLPTNQIWGTTAMEKNWTLTLLWPGSTDLADIRTYTSNELYVSIGESRFQKSGFVFELSCMQTDRQTIMSKFTKQKCYILL